MHIPVLDLLPHVHEEHLDLLGRPLECLGEQPRHHATQPKQQVLHLKGADQLEPLVLGPRVARHLVDDLGHLLEPALLEPALPAHRVVDGCAEDLGALRQRVRELAHRAVRRQRVVVALQDPRDAVELDPAAGFEMSARSSAGRCQTYRTNVLPVRLVDQSRPVPNSDDQVTREDEIERVFLPRPVLLNVVELEATVGRDPTFVSQ